MNKNFYFYFRNYCIIQSNYHGLTELHDAKDLDEYEKKYVLCNLKRNFFKCRKGRYRKKICKSGKINCLK